MKEPVVIDSACLIGLERIGQLDVLPSLFDPLVITPEVEREFGSTLSWLRVESPADGSLVAALKMMLDDGEAAAIALACEYRWRIVLDDRRARSVAERLGLAIVGTVGVLVQAKRGGIIPALRPLLDDLEVNGFYLSIALKNEALNLVGE